EIKVEGGRRKAEIKAEGGRRKAEIKAEGRRQKAEIKAEGRRQKAEIKVEGRRQKAEIKAEGRRQKAEEEEEVENSNFQTPYFPNSLIPHLLNSLQACDDLLLRPVLIFDQFEEFFFANPDILARREFFQFVVDCLELPGALKIVLSLRQDYLHYLLEARQVMKRSQLPQGSMARSLLNDILGKEILYEIGNFTPEEAKEVIQQLTTGARMYLEPALVDVLVTDLAEPLGEVRPIEMQVVGAQLQTQGITTLERYRALGDDPKEVLVQGYLEDVVQDCGDRPTQQLAELVLFLLTDERGTRPLKTRSQLEQGLTELTSERVWEFEHDAATGPIHHQNPKSKIQNPFDFVLHVLCGSGLVIEIPDTPLRYQLVHDYLAEVIRARQKSWSDLLKEERQKRQQAEAAQASLTEQLGYSQQANSHILEAQSTAKLARINQPFTIMEGLLSPIILFSFIVIILRYLGVFQDLELATFDQLVRLLPKELPDDRIVIVGIDEEDISNFRSHPLSDETISQVLRNIKAQNPRVIGLDIYRHIPYGQGHSELQQVFRSTPNLIGIETIRDRVNQGVAAPPLLAEQGQVGFNNVLLDPDNRVRRNLLYWTVTDLETGEKEHKTSFSLTAAFMYLREQGIVSKSSVSKELQLDDAVFAQFRNNDGGYVRADDGGYQVLANFRNNAEPFPIISITDVWTGNIPPGLMSDRIVFIGSTALSPQNKFDTPLHKTSISGVELHAHMASEVLSVTLNDRALFTVWADWLEDLWLFTWVLVILYPLKLRKSWAYWLLTSMIVPGLIGISYLLLNFYSLWIPIASPVVAIVGTFLISTEIFRLNKSRFKEFVRLLHASKQVSTPLKRLAIQYSIAPSNPQASEVVCELSEEMDRQLSNRQTVRRIGQLSEALDWIPEPYPETFDPVALQLLEISKELKEVGGCSNEQKLKLITQAQTNLQALLDQGIVRKHQKVVSSWLAVLSTELQSLNKKSDLAVNDQHNT
ncbi:MAG: CHASE2 domain-containing protein, partial [Cyanothece sp. SIO2G6]|nr:CHASE2 domain-containing protein [Cyanothece sp. SIO2G6]